MTATDPLTDALATTLRTAREARGLSASALADASGVSRAMIGKVERGEAQPTAVLLGRLSAALGLTLSELLARAEGGTGRLARAADQPVWQDPETGYTRRAVSPLASGAIQLTDVTLPAGAHVAYPAEAYTFAHRQIWVLEGTLVFEEGDVRHLLGAGDCLELGAAAPCTFRNESGEAVRYVVVVARRHG